MALGLNDYGSSGRAGGGRSGVSSSSSDPGGYSISRLRQMYLDWASSKSKEIDEQRVARHYYHGDQWTAKEISVMNSRGQPVITNNLIGRKIDGVVGLVERLRQDPKGFPRTPNQEAGADLVTEVVRYALDSNDWQPLSSEAARSAGMVGIGGLEMSLTQGDHGDPDIKLAQVDAETFFYDPRSVRLDFSDARYMGVAKWIDLDQAKEMFPDKAEEIGDLMDDGGSGMDTSAQQDRTQRWVNVDLERVFIVEHWYIKGGKWRFCFYIGDTELRSGESPFKDEKGKSSCRFIMFSSQADHDGDRYGFVRNLKPLQDEVNARRSKALHTIHVRRVIADKGAVDDIELVRREAVRADGVIIKNPNTLLEFDDASKAFDLGGQLKLLEDAKMSIENFGPNPALIGTGIENKSGRAIALMQQSGIAELGPFILAYRGWKMRVYRAIWNAVQTYWTSERWLRVTDDEGLAQFVSINKLDLDPMGQPTIANNLGALDVDIILDEGPDTMNLMQDTFDVLTTLAQNGVPVPPQVFLELSQIDTRTKKKVLAILSQPNPMQEIGVQQAGAELEKTQAETAKIKTDAAKTIHGVLHEVAMGPPQPEQPQNQFAGA